MSEIHYKTELLVVRNGYCAYHATRAHESVGIRVERAYQDRTEVIDRATERLAAESGLVVQSAEK